MISLKKIRGLAAIELTMILPFLLLLIFATAEFSRLLYQYNALTKIVRDASRYLIDHASPGSTQAINITQATLDEVNAIFIHGDVSSSTNELLPNLANADITVSVDGDFITIHASYVWQPIFADRVSTFGLGNDIDLNFPLVVNYTMRAL
ncbi:TadE/TadG family type IV pilus assembly protein [Colwelliaceae bacterium BS250]